MDVFKGWVSVNYIMFVSSGCNPFTETVTASQFEIQLAFGIAAVVGHLFPIYTGFRGGKGVRNIIRIIDWIKSVGCFQSSMMVFVIVFFVSKYVSLGSILASIALSFSSFFCFRKYRFKLFFRNILYFCTNFNVNNSSKKY